MDFEYMKMLAEIDAREKGLSEGREQGLKEGRKEGRKEGKEEGLKEGIQKGEKEGAARVLITLVREGVLTLDDAAKRSGMSDEEFKRRMSQ